MKNKTLCSLGHPLAGRLWLSFLLFLFGFACPAFSEDTRPIQPEKEIKIEEGKWLDWELPLESNLNIQGRKLVELKFGHSGWIDDKDRDDNPSSGGLASGLTINQQLQVRLKGDIGNRIFVNVNFDDTKSGDEKENISVVYQGEKEEVVQKVAFGDLNLVPKLTGSALTEANTTFSLTNTEFIALKKNLFGIGAYAQFRDFLRFTFVGSREKGFSETKTFKGAQTQTIDDILDTNFRGRRYYDPLAYQTNKSDSLPIRSEKIYLDDQDASNNQNADTMTVLSENGSDSCTGRFDTLYPGVDYTIDYNKGIITFNRAINTDFVIAVSLNNGSPIMIKDKNNTSYFAAYELKNRYPLGYKVNIDLNDPDFLLEIRDKSNKNYFDRDNDGVKDSNEPTYLIIFGLDLDRNNRIDPAFIDLDLSLLNFSGNTQLLDDTQPFVVAPSDPISIEFGFSAAEIATLSHPNLYTQTSPSSKYTIHLEYKSEVKAYTLGQINIVSNSEEVYIDGKRKKKGADYFIDYETGFLTFIGDQGIDEETEIKITYEYSPFIGGGLKTLAGLRAEFEPNKYFSLGSTCIWEGAPKPSEIPSPGEKSEELALLGLDTNINLDGLLKGWLSSKEISANVHAEIAHSYFNPNNFEDGRALVDDLEAAWSSSSISLNEEDWSLSSRIGNLSDTRGKILYENEDYSKKAGPDNEEVNHLKDEDRESLVLKYDFSDGSNWAGVMHLISRTPRDFSKADYLKIWIKKENNEKVFVDLGQINEDRDGDGVLDSEDVDGDGLLGKNEDVGWFFNETGSDTSRVGPGNNLLDKEDLDGDGELGSDDYLTLELADTFLEISDTNSASSINSGWQMYLVPLSDVEIKKRVKHIRIRLEKGDTDSATVYISELAIVENNWDISLPENISDTHYLHLGQINREEYGDYTPPPDLSLDEDENENSLVLRYKFDREDTGTAYYELSSALDYSDYKTLKLYLHSQTLSDTFFFQFGADENTYLRVYKSLDFEGWQTMTIDLEEARTKISEGEDSFSLGGLAYESKGSFRLTNIKELRVGVLTQGAGEGEIWVDHIRTEEVKKEEGTAHRITISSTYKDWLTLGWDQKDKDAGFRSIGQTTSVEDLTSREFKTSLSYLKYLPADYTWAWEHKKTDPDKTKDVITSELGDNLIKKHIFNLKFNPNNQFKLLPVLTGSYEDFQQTNKDIWTNLLEKESSEKTLTGTLSHSYNYKFPQRIWIVPTGEALSLSTSYKHTEEEKKIDEEVTTTTSRTKKRAQNGSLILNFSPLKPLSGATKFSLGQKREAEEPLGLGSETALKSREAGLDFNTTLTSIPGLVPDFKWNSKFNEDYTTSTITGWTKNASLGTNLSLSSRFTPKEWRPELKFFSFDHTYSLDISAKYSDLSGKEETLNTIKDIYKDYFEKRLAGSGPGNNLLDRRTSASINRSHSLKTKWFLWQPLTTSLNFDHSNKEEQSQSSILKTITSTYNLDLNLDLKKAINWERVLLSKLITDYRLSKTEKVGVSTTITHSPSASLTCNWSQKFRTTLKANLSLQREEIGKIENKDLTIDPSIEANYSFSKDRPFGIPLTRRKITFHQKMELASSLSANLKRREENGVPKIDQDKYALSLSLQYNLLSNLTSTWGFSTVYFQDHLEKGQDYYSVEASVKLEFRF